MATLTQRLMRRARNVAKAALGRDTAVAAGGPRPVVTLNVQSPDVLAGQVAIVTGGSGEIGQAICLQLAARGAIVHVGGTRPAKIEAVVAEIAGLGGKAHALKLDMSSEADIVAAVARVVQAHGRLDILVNCAGGSARERHAKIADQATEVIDDLLAVNLRGLMLATREALRAMLPAARGRIVNIGSVIAEQGKAGFSEYAAAKAGVNGFTRSVAMEVGTSGITVNCVSPGIVHRGVVTDEVRAQVAGTNWMGTVGRAEDVAAMVCHLVGPDGGFITGQVIAVDGGRSLGLKGD